MNVPNRYRFGEKLAPTYNNNDSVTRYTSRYLSLSLHLLTYFISLETPYKSDTFACFAYSVAFIAPKEPGQLVQQLQLLVILRPLVLIGSHIDASNHTLWLLQHVMVIFLVMFLCN